MRHWHANRQSVAPFDFSRETLYEKIEEDRRRLFGHCHRRSHASIIQFRSPTNISVTLNFVDLDDQLAMNADQFSDANATPRDVGIDYSQDKYMREIQDSMNEVREAMKIWQVADPMKDVREAMKAWQLVDPMNEVREAMKALQLADPMNEVREAMKALQLADPMNEVREAVKTWQLADPMHEVREAMKTWQLPDTMKDVHEAMKVWQIADPMKEIRGVMDALRAEGWIDAIAKDSWRLASTHFAEEITLHEDNSISVGATVISSSEIQNLVDQIANKAFEQSTKQLMPVVNAIFDALASLKNPVLEKILAWVIIPIFINAMFSLINPIADHYVKAALEGGRTQASVREMKKDVKEHVLKSIDKPADLDSYRFVSIKNLDVHTNPAGKSPVLGSLHFGQVLVLIERRKAWSLVAWSDDDGHTALQGWVFSRYVSRLK